MDSGQAAQLRFVGSGPLVEPPKRIDGRASFDAIARRAQESTSEWIWLMQLRITRPRERIESDIRTHRSDMDVDHSGLTIVSSWIYSGNLGKYTRAVR